MTYKLDERMTEDRFVDLCSRMTRREIADQLGVTIWTVVHYEERFGSKPLPGKRGRRPLPGVRVRPSGARARTDALTTPYRASWLVQGGLWADLRHTMDGAIE